MTILARRGQSKIKGGRIREWGRWQAAIMINHRNRHLVMYDTADQAAAAYAAAAKFSTLATSPVSETMQKG
jgi:hypothetical protein